MGSTYNLVDKKLPVVSGRLLAFLANFFELVGEPIGINSFLCADAGLYVLRDKKYTEPPISLPVWPPTQKMVEAALNVHDGSTLSSTEYLEELQKEVDAQVVSGMKGAVVGEHRFLTCRDFYTAYKSGHSTPAKVAEQLIERIQASDELSPSLGAVWSWNKDKILKQAQESTVRYQAGRPLSIVDGVPVIVKDELDIEGFETGVGTTFINKGNPAKENAHLIALLRSHGAVIIGKSTMHEIGLGVTNFNPSTTTPRNPYRPEHSPGGSSGGSGAAVGSGLCPIAIGCDGGGSIRIPSSYCGIYGLKPTQGRVSGRGEYPIAPTVTVSGPMCASMEDLSIVYAIIAGRDIQHPNSLFQPQVVLPRPLKVQQQGQLQGLRIGIYRRWFEDVTHPEISQVCYRMLDHLVEDHGAVLVDIEIPELLENGKAHNITIAAENLSVVGNNRKKLNHQCRLEMSMLAGLCIQDYVRAQQQRTRSIRLLESLFGHKENNSRHHAQYPCLIGGKENGVVDLIVTPTVASLPSKVHAGAVSHGESDFFNTCKTAQFMMMANFTGIPGITAVAGYTQEGSTHHDGDQYENGLPIGIQFMSQWWDEKRLIHVANVCEQVLESRPKPKIWLGDYTL
ncbi:MAG: amidase signature domain-containing protein [Linnemannia gamsii]|nr:MAG: amidase signature domain-containing protein [Linnemannia gamsii]